MFCLLAGSENYLNGSGKLGCALSLVHIGSKILGGHKEPRREDHPKSMPGMEKQLNPGRYNRALLSLSSGSCEWLIRVDVGAGAAGAAAVKSQAWHLAHVTEATPQSSLPILPLGQAPAMKRKANMAKIVRSDRARNMLLRCLSTFQQPNISRDIARM